ncbi:MAG TPA: HEAT repeat domain-containing protein [Polyangiaceae bacterium]
MRQVEEALARQVIYGGDLATNLLEVALVDEAALTRIVAESWRVPAAPSGELPVAPEPAQLIALDVAVKRSIVPIGLEGEILVLAVVEPMTADLEEQLMFALGVAIEQRAAPAVRVHQAIARLYGQPLDPRMRRLVARLSGHSLPAGTTPVPLPNLTSSPPRAASSVPRKPTTGTPPLGMPLARIVLASTERVDRSSDKSPASPSSKPPSRRRNSPLFPAMHAAALSEATALLEPSPTAEAEREPERRPLESVAPPTPVLPERRAGLLQRDVPSGVRSARRRRGPITLEIAKQDVADIADRDVLLGLFFDFTRQFFDYAALFLVHGDIAEGRDAFGAGATREQVVGIGVPLDMPSLMATAREQRRPIMGGGTADGLDAVLLADLQRPRDARITVVPVAVRTRVVALVLGDCTDGAIDSADLDQVTALTAVVGKALERIIVQRKRGGLSTSAMPVVPSPTARSATPPAGRSMQAAPVSESPPPSQPSSVPPPTPVHVTIAMSSMPPPPANVVTVRKISGPPIPREEPDYVASSTMSPFPAFAPPSIELSMRITAPSPSEAESRPASALPPAAPPNDDEAPGPSSAPPPRPPANDVHDATRAPQGPIDAGPISEELDSRALFEALGWETGAEEPEAAPPSSAIAVPPHIPPVRHASSADALPSVIVDLDQELSAIVDRVVKGDTDETAEGELLRQGERAMPAIMARFPGPVTIDRERVTSAALPPRASECGPILRLVARERKVALPFVLDRLTSPDREIRGWATHLLCEMPYAEAIPHALDRLKDSDPGVRTSAAHAIAVVGKAFPELTRDAIRDLVTSPKSADRAAAMQAIARLRLTTLGPELMGALEDSDASVALAAHQALVHVTCQNFGSDPKPWRKWWEVNASRHRIEWLIDALTHDVSEIRRAAGEELRATTREYFGYSSELPPRDRDRTQQRYRDWWITEGRVRFRRRP